LIYHWQEYRKNENIRQGFDRSRDSLPAGRRVLLAELNQTAVFAGATESTVFPQAGRDLGDETRLKHSTLVTVDSFRHDSNSRSLRSNFIRIP
jgi:hypothetical protein